MSPGLKFLIGVAAVLFVGFFIGNATYSKLTTVNQIDANNSNSVNEIDDTTQKSRVLAPTPNLTKDIILSEALVSDTAQDPVTVKGSFTNAGKGADKVTLKVLFLDERGTVLTETDSQTYTVAVADTVNYNFTLTGKTALLKTYKNYKVTVVNVEAPD